MTTLGISGRQFTIDGVPTFLLGVSYYNVGNGWHLSDLEAIAARGFNLIKVWTAGPADWTTGGAVLGSVGISHLTAGGLWASDALRDDLIALVDACDALGIVVDIAVQDAGSVPPSRVTNDSASRNQAIATICGTLAEKTNVMFDLMNEHNSGQQPLTDAQIASFGLWNTFLAAAPNRIGRFTACCDHLSQFEVWTVSAAQLARIEFHAVTQNEPVLSDHYAKSARPAEWWNVDVVDQYNALRTVLDGLGKNIPIYQDESAWEFSHTESTPGRWMTSARIAKDAGLAGYVIDVDAAGLVYPLFANLSAKARIVVDSVAAHLTPVSALSGARID